MKVTLKWEEFNKIQDFAKAYAGKDNTRPVLTFINIKVKEDRLVAEMVDGFKLARLEFVTQETNEETGFLLPITNKVKKQDVFVEIELSEDGQEISLTTLKGKSIIKAGNGEFVNADRVWPQDEIKETVYFSTKLLQEALKPFKNEMIRIDYYGEFKPIIITDEITKDTGLVLPRRVTR
ncbi:MAG: hypothetical protein GX787_08260 [Tissierellia bacterium]|nr:hypothetical protein [Tissierellia bacterium]